jgi:hypothetical protein
VRRGGGPSRDTEKAREFERRGRRPIEGNAEKARRFARKAGVLGAPVVLDGERPTPTLRRGRKPSLSKELRDLERELQEAWKTFARAGVCAVCRRRCGVVRGHHVIEKQLLRKQCRTLGYDAEQTLRVLWDRQNELRVGDQCHNDHHFSGRATVTRAVVARGCPDLPGFLDALRLGWALAYYYPEGGAC